LHAALLFLRDSLPFGSKIKYVRRRLSTREDAARLKNDGNSNAGANVGVCRELVPAVGGSGGLGLESRSYDGGFAAVLFRQTGLETSKERLSRAILLVTIVMPVE